jgi:hypothetical protein
MPRGTEARWYYPSSVPEGLDRELAEWLRREFLAIFQGQEAFWDIPITTVAPERAREGMMRYADGTAWNPGGGKGVYVYNGTVWTKL